MPVSKKELSSVLLSAFPDCVPDVDILIEDTVGDQNHYSVFVASCKFKDTSPLARHKMVNNALKDLLAERLHAVSIKTKVKD